MRDQEFNYSSQGEFNSPSWEEFHPPRAEIAPARESGEYRGESTPQKRGLDKSRKRALMQAAAALVTVTVVAQGLGAATKTEDLPPPEYREFLDGLLAACVDGNDDEILTQMEKCFEPELVNSFWYMPVGSFYDGDQITETPGATPVLWFHSYSNTYDSEVGESKGCNVVFYKNGVQLREGGEGIQIDRYSDDLLSRCEIFHGNHKYIEYIEAGEVSFEKSSALADHFQLLSGKLAKSYDYPDNYDHIQTWEGTFVSAEDDAQDQIFSYGTYEKGKNWYTYLEDGVVTYADNWNGRNLDSAVTLEVKNGYLQLNDQVFWDRYEASGSDELPVPYAYFLSVFPDEYGMTTIIGPLSPDRDSPEKSLYHTSGQVAQYHSFQTYSVRTD